MSRDIKNIAIQDITASTITSEADNFTVIPPKKGMFRPYHTENKFNGSRGGVSFHDDLGHLLAIYYMRIPVTFKADISELKQWFKKVGLPTYFLPLSKDSKITQEKELTVGGEAAYFATVEIPNGSIVLRGGHRFDTKRNILILVRHGYVYLLSEEFCNVLDVFKGKNFKIGSNLESSEHSLIEFYETITFTNK
jgi:hypothetical protein